MNSLGPLCLWQCFDLETDFTFPVQVSEINGVQAGMVQTLILKLQELAKRWFTLANSLQKAGYSLQKAGSIKTNK